MLDLWNTATGQRYQDYSDVFTQNGLNGWGDVPLLQRSQFFCSVYVMGVILLACVIACALHGRSKINYYRRI
jgi:hypothetical protein